MSKSKKLRQREQRGPLDNPAVPLNSPAVWSWITSGEPTAAGELISESSALQINTVFACVRVLAESVAGIPLKTFRQITGGRQEATDTDLYDLLTRQPNPEQTAFSFFESLVGALALTGNCYAFIQRKGSQVEAIWPLHPLKTSAVRVDGKLMYKTTDGQAINSPARLIDPADIIAIPLFSFDGITGFSPIAMARQELGLNRATQKFGARWFGNGAHPGGVLSTASSLNAKQVEDTKASWQSATTGDNQHKTAVLWGDWKYNAIGISPEDSQFLQLRQFSRAEIAAIFRVPPHLVGDTTRLSNSNHMQQSLEFVTYTLKPYLARFEQEIGRKCLPTAGRNASQFAIQFDLRELLRGDFATSATGWAMCRQWGIMSADDVRSEMGMNPIGGKAGSMLWMPVNMTDAEKPVTAVPAAVAEPKPEPKTEEPPPTDSERNLLAGNAEIFLRVYRDNVGRLLARETRSFETISQVFRPLIDTIVDVAAGPESPLSADISERIHRDAVKLVEKRAAAWSPDQADAIAGPEFLKFVRSIVANVGREVGAQNALKLLETINEA